MQARRNLLVLTVLWLATDVTAHGGWFPPRTRYGGPGDVVPAEPRGPASPGRPSTPSTPSTPGDIVPSTPRSGGPVPPATPTTPGTGGTARPGAGPATPRGVDLTPDLTRWDIWWHYNRDRYLQLRRTLQRVIPTTRGDEFFVGIRPESAEDRIAVARGAIRDRIAPVLRAILQQKEGRQRDEISSALVALAKLGVEPAAALGAIRPHLASGDQEVRETAALALGILGHEAGLPLLLALAGDESLGRSLVESREVDERTRAFACYGLGLVGHRLNEEEDGPLLGLVRATLLRTLADDARATPDLEVAALFALGIVPHGNVPRLRDVFPALDAVLENASGRRRDLVRTHVPTLFARLGAEHQVERLSRMLEDKKEDPLVRQSIVLALGTLGHGAAPYRAEGITDTLLANLERSRSATETYFTAIALGQVGWPRGIEHLLHQVEKGPRLERTWSALGLGIHAFHTTDDAARTKIRRMLSDLFQRERAADLRGALATGLGLCRTRADAPILRRAFEEEREPILRGQLAIALGLTQAREAAPSLLDALDESVRHPEAFQDVAIGLGLLQDRRALTNLLERLRQARSTFVRAALARAIGWIGDARAVAPLIEAAEDESLTGEARAFAIVALGLLGDKEDLPFQAKLAENANYFAGTSTLNGGINGVLDIL